MPRLCFALDLKDEPDLIAEYERWHRPDQIWPDIVASLEDAGICDLEIFRVADRLFMVMEVDADYSPAAKAASDANNPRVQAWETLMWRFQKALPCARPGDKWVAMQRIFSLSESRNTSRSGQSS
jgi:L-rhamnose mutarotase